MDRAEFASEQPVAGRQVCNCHDKRAGCTCVQMAVRPLVQSVFARHFPVQVTAWIPETTIMFLRSVAVFFHCFAPAKVSLGVYVPRPSHVNTIHPQRRGIHEIIQPHYVS